VTFKQVGNVVIFGESGPVSSAGHIQPADAKARPTELFQRLAPGRALPPALVEAERQADLAAAAGEHVEIGSKTGEMETSQPDATSAAPMTLIHATTGSCPSSWFNTAHCQFPSGPAGQGAPKGIWRLLDWWNGAWENANASWGFHVACGDIGAILLTVNVGSVGSVAQTIQQGYWFAWSWYAGSVCSGGGCFLWTCQPTFCAPNIASAASTITNATNKRFQYCGYYDWVN
jgi:hypothetical protein